MINDTLRAALSPEGTLSRQDLLKGLNEELDQLRCDNDAQHLGERHTAVLRGSIDILKDMIFVMEGQDIDA